MIAVYDTQRLALPIEVFFELGILDLTSAVADYVANLSVFKRELLLGCQGVGGCGSGIDRGNVRL